MGPACCRETSSALPLTRRNGELYFYALYISFYAGHIILLCHIVSPTTWRPVCENIVGDLWNRPWSRVCLRAGLLLSTSIYQNERRLYGKTFLLMTDVIQDGQCNMAQLEASKWTSTNQRVTSRWERRLLIYKLSFGHRTVPARCIWFCLTAMMEVNWYSLTRTRRELSPPNPPKHTHTHSMSHEALSPEGDCSTLRSRQSQEIDPHPPHPRLQISIMRCSCAVFTVAVITHTD